MLRFSSVYNVTYHPILDNYPEYQNMTKKSFDKNLRLNFSLGDDPKNNMFIYLRAICNVQLCIILFGCESSPISY